jgi:ribonuclease P protein component
MRQKTASFTKGERLCGVKTVSRLFAEGKTLTLPSLRIIYSIMPVDNALQPVRVLISVPKRYFRKAVDRNLVRRRIKEAYRKNKTPLINALSESGKRLDLAIIWTDAVIRQYADTERSVTEMVQKLSHLK